jgi:hypothetical protein
MQRAILIPQLREQVQRALTDSAALAECYPNENVFREIQPDTKIIIGSIAR